MRERIGGGHEAADHGVAALAVEQFARLEVLLRRRHGVGAPARGAARGFAPQADGSDRNPHLQADQVPALVHARIPAARVGLHAVFHEAAPDVLRVALEYHPHAHADVVGNRLAVELQRRGHLDLPLVVQAAALRLRPHDGRKVVDRARRERQAPGRRRQAGGVAHGARLDRGLRAVEKGVEHLGVQAARLRLLGGESPVLPDGVGRGLRVLRQPLVPAPGGDDVEPRSACPVHQVADDRRLVAVGEAVHHARLPRALGEDRAAKGVGFHRDHHHVLAVPESGERVLHPRHRVAGRLDDDVHLRIRDQLLPVIRDPEARRVEPDAPQVLPRAVRREVGDAGDANPGSVRDLRKVHGGELAGADDADAERPAFRLTLQQQSMQVHRGSRPAGIRSG